MKCINCISFKYESPTGQKCCSIWTDFKMNISRLPIETSCPSCGGFSPVSPNEFLLEINRYGPKKYGVGQVKHGANVYFGGIIVQANDRCAFFKDR